MCISVMPLIILTVKFPSLSHVAGVPFALANSSGSNRRTPLLVSNSVPVDKIYTGMSISGFLVESEYSSVCQLLSCTYVYTYITSN